MDDCDHLSFKEYLRECALGEAVKNSLDPDHFAKLIEDGLAPEDPDPEGAIAATAARLGELSWLLDGDFDGAVKALASSVATGPRSGGGKTHGRI